MVIPISCLLFTLYALVAGLLPLNVQGSDDRVMGQFEQCSLSTVDQNGNLDLARCSGRQSVVRTSSGVDQLAKQMAKVDRALFVARIKEQALTEVLESDLGMQFNYQTGDIKLEESLKEICNRKCDNQLYTTLFKRGKSFISDLQQDQADGLIVRQEPVAIADRLNKRLSQLNDRLNSVQKRLNLSRKGIRGKVKLDQLPLEVREEYLLYQQEYQNLLLHSLGNLLLTSSLRQKTKPIRSLEKDLTYRGVGRSGRPGHRATIKHRLKAHSLLTDRIYRGRKIIGSRGRYIASAVKDAREQLASFGQRIAKVNGSGQDLKGVKELLRLTPMSVGRVLGANREFRDDVCQALSEVKEQDSKNSYWRKKGEQAILALDIGSLALLGAAIPTYGVSLLPAAAAQGAKLAIKKLLIYGVRMGSGAMVSEIGLSGASSVAYGREHDDLLGGYLSGNRDDGGQMLTKEQHSRDKRSEYRLRTMFAAFGLVNFGVIGTHLGRIKSTLSTPAKATPNAGKVKVVSPGKKIARNKFVVSVNSNRKNPFKELLSFFKGSRGKFLHRKYNAGNRLRLDVRDRAYFVGLADSIEKELKQHAKYRKNPALLKRDTKRKLDDVLKRCRDSK
jgi:hypothetical protein